MFFFFHLLAGVATGLFLSEVLRSRRWFLPVAVGSILPDLIDKPLGHILFAATIGYGRIIGHSLIFFAILLIFGFLLWKYRGSVLLFGLGIGVLLHQALDSMWEIPITWYYPLYGPFPAKMLPDFFINSFWNSLAAPQEWVAACILIPGTLLMLADLTSRQDGCFRTLSRIKLHCMSFSGIVMLGLGLLLAFNISRIESSHLFLLVKGGDPLIVSLAFIWCGLVFVFIPLRHLSKAE